MVTLAHPTAIVDPHERLYSRYVAGSERGRPALASLR
jgi:hypothetical protein